MSKFPIMILLLSSYTFPVILVQMAVNTTAVQKGQSISSNWVLYLEIITESSWQCAYHTCVLVIWPLLPGVKLNIIDLFFCNVSYIVHLSYLLSKHYNFICLLHFSNIYSQIFCKDLDEVLHHLLDKNNR